MVRQNQDVDWATYGLFVVFGLSAWLYVNGFYAEQPTLVNQTPEGWALPATISLVIQAGNVGPLLYLAAARRGYAPTVSLIWFVLLLTILATFLLAFLWQETARVGGDETSIAIIGLTFAASFAACLSSVLYYPFAGQYPDTYVTALVTGESVSGIVASGITWIQNCRHHELFGPQSYFITLSIIMAMSAIAFGLIVYLPRSQRQRGRGRKPSEGVQHSQDDEVNINHEADRDTHPLLVLKSNEDHQLDDPVPCESLCQTLLPGHVRRVVLLALIALVNFLANGVSAAIGSYACLPYGNSTYHVAQTLGLSLAPFASFAAFFYQMETQSLCYLALVMTMSMTYVFGIALQSPSPPMQHSSAGQFLVVATSALSSVLFAYIKSTAVFWCKVLDGASPKKGVMTQAGIAMQVGSCIGAVSMYLLVRFSGWFSQ